MAVVEKTSGGWNVNGHWVQAGNGAVVAYDSSLEALSVPPADVTEIVRRLTNNEAPLAHRGQVKNFGAGPVISKTDHNCWTSTERPNLWTAVNAGSIAAYQARLPAVV